MASQDRTPTGPVPIIPDSNLGARQSDVILAAGAGFALAATLAFFVTPHMLTLIPLALAAFGVTMNAVGTMRARSGVGMAVGVSGSLISVAIIAASLIAHANQAGTLLGP